jgi:hypothetical protein
MNVTQCSASLALIALAGLAGTAEAATLVGLTGDNHLIVIDGDNRTAAKAVPVAGVGGKLIGIDVRPADGKLYGVGTDNTIYVIDVASGRTTGGAKLKTAFPAGQRAVVDFNPVADRLRLMAADGTNYRINVDTGDVIVDGRLAYAKDGPMGSDTPKVTAGAYTNSMAGAKSTALYNIDAAKSMLVLQSPPNDGVLKGVGALGVEVGAMAAFDIVTDGDGTATGIAVIGRTLYAIDLAKGAAKSWGQIKGVEVALIDVAALPAK